MLSDLRGRIGRATEVIPHVDSIFEQACLFIVTEAFKDMKQEGRYKLTWKESRFSAHLIGYMRKVRDREDVRLQIDPECHLYREGVLEGKEDPDTAPRIDIRILGGWVYENVYYAMEAKILVEENWETRDSYRLRARYIDTGIDNFVSGRYSPDIPRGCILGYVVQGTPSEITVEINGLLTHRGRKKERIADRHSINGCPDCYRSRHIRATDKQSIELYHILLTFC